MTARELARGLTLLTIGGLFLLAIYSLKIQAAPCGAVMPQAIGQRFRATDGRPKPPVSRSALP
jgi:hypothetical protein